MHQHDGHVIAITMDVKTDEDSDCINEVLSRDLIRDFASQIDVQ